MFIMKKEAFLFLIIIFLIISVSAYYVCSDKSLVKDDSRKIKIGEAKTINGLLLGLANADESAAVNRMNAELIIDAQLANLTNQSNSASINFTDGKNHNIILVNSTESEANIKIDGNIKLIGEGEIIPAGDLQVCLLSLQGRYPGEVNVSIMAGIGKISLSNYDNITKIATVYGKEYLIELSYASNEDAIIKVKRCDNESAKFIEIIDNSSLNKTEEGNNMNSTLNETNKTNEDDYSSNQTNSTKNNSNISQNEQKNKENDIIRYVAIGGLIFFIIIVLVLLVRHMSNKNQIKQ